MLAGTPVRLARNGRMTNYLSATAIGSPRVANIDTMVWRAYGVLDRVAHGHTIGIG